MRAREQSEAVTQRVATSVTDNNNRRGYREVRENTCGFLLFFFLFIAFSNRYRGFTNEKC